MLQACTVWGSRGDPPVLPFLLTSEQLLPVLLLVLPRPSEVTPVLLDACRHISEPVHSFAIAPATAIEDPAEVNEPLQLLSPAQQPPPHAAYH